MSTHKRLTASERAERARSNGQMLLCNIAPILIREHAAELEKLKAVNTDDLTPRKKDVRAEQMDALETVIPVLQASIDAPRWKLGIFEKGKRPTEDNPEPRGLYRPTVEVPSPDICLLTEEVPYVTVSSKIGKPMIRRFGKSGDHRRHVDSGIREWSDEMEAKVDDWLKAKRPQRGRPPKHATTTAP